MEVLFIVYILGAVFIFGILYFIIEGAVKEGTLKALMEFERIRSKEKENG